MSTPDPTQAIGQLQAGLSQQIADFRQLVAPLDTMWASPDKLILAMRALEALTAAQAFAASFAGQAVAQRAAGDPSLAALVEKAAQDTATAYGTYAQMYQDTVTTMQQSNTILNTAVSEAATSMLAATADNQRRFDAAMRGLIAVSEQACPHCGLYLGSAYPYWRFCPRCGSSL